MSRINRLDPRVIRTRQLLRDALVSLIPERGYDAISIQDIADRATINRTTFYLHYRDKNELLEEAFYQLIVKATPLPSLEGIPPQKEGLESIALIFRQISHHSDFFRILLNEESAPMFNTLVRRYITDVCLKWVLALQPDDTRVLVDPEIAINFLGSAYLGVVAWWLQDDMKQSPEEMAGHLMNLTVMGLIRSLGIDLD